jgi:tRNA (guanine-N7-)-methyltransferase
MERPSIRSYSIRGSRITDAQRQAKTALQAVHGIAFKQELIDLKAIFPNSNSIIMEIGFGMGEATAIIAKNHPNNGYIAVDVHPPGIGKLLARIVENDLTNLKVIEDDVHVVLQHMIPDNSLDGIHLYFPDPWPKKKHNKRRIVNAGFLQLIHPKIKTGGFIHIATDWVPYAESIKEVFAASTLFAGGVIDKPEWRPVTRFEGQGIDKDHAVNDMLYIKV